MSILSVPIRGMHCKSCELLVGQHLEKIKGVKKAIVNHSRGTAEIHYDGALPTNEDITKAVADAGYEVGIENKSAWISGNWTDYKNLLIGGVILLLLYGAARWFGIFKLSPQTENGGLFIALLVGLVAGISTCMAMVGGLVLGLSARHAELHPEATAKQKFRPHIYFNLGRVIGFALLGGLIGAAGSALRPSAGFLGIMTVIVGLVMIFLGLKLVEIFPFLKNKNISLPTGIAKFFGLHKENKEYNHSAAILTGALTFFLPCGFTQAMQLFAVSTGSFWQGATIMGLFALGTAPGLLGIGGLTTIFSARGGSAFGGKGQKAKIFFAATGIAVILMGWFNITNGSRLLSTGATTNNNPPPATTSSETQEVRMEQNSYGYSPNVFTVQKGKKVKWIITSTNAYSCASSIMMPKYNINVYLKKGENIIEFTPTESGEIPFSCSMGMYTGKFIVTDDAIGVKSETNALAPTQHTCGMAAGGGGCGCGARRTQ